MGSKPPRQGRWDVGEKVEIGGIYVIRKGRSLGLRTLSRPESIQSIYAALSEHAQVAKAGADLRPHRASLALKAASALEVRELSFSLEDSFREKLDPQ